MLGSAREAFYARSRQQADDDGVPSGLADAIQFVVELMRDAKKGEAYLLKLGASAQAATVAKKQAEDFESQRARAEAERDKAFAQIEAARAAHEAAMAKREKLVADTEKQVANSLAAAKADAKAAADLKAAAKRKLDAVEAAVNAA